MDDAEKVNFATEVAFNNLTRKAGELGLQLNPAMGLMYLPDQHVTEQFREACKAVLNSLGVSV